MLIMGSAKTYLLNSCPQLLRTSINLEAVLTKSWHMNRNASALMILGNTSPGYSVMGKLGGSGYVTYARLGFTDVANDYYKAVDQLKV